MASVASAAADVVDPFPEPPPPTERQRPSSSSPSSDEDDKEKGTRVFGEGEAAASALASWASAEAPKLPPLRTLDLRFSDRIDGAALSLVGAHARGLRHLRLDGCGNIVSSSPGAVPKGGAAEKTEGEEEQEGDGDDGVRHSAPELCAVLARASRTLRSLSLYWIPRLPSDAVYAAAACTALTSLNLSGCTRAVDDSSLLALATSLGGGGGRGSGGRGSGLRRLDLTRCQLLTDAGMARAFALLPRLVELRLYAVESFGDLAARALCGGGGGSGEGGGGENENAAAADAAADKPSLSRLEVLDVCGSRDLSDAAAAELVEKRCSGGSLRVLGCGWVPNVGDLLAVAVGRCCGSGGGSNPSPPSPPSPSSLESLSLHGNRNLTDKGLDALVQGLASSKKLRALDVRGCVGVSEQRRTREALREAFGEQLVEFALQR